MTTKWTIDNSHSEIGFKVRHMMISNVSGNFGTFAGTAESTDAPSAFEFSAAIDSISTGVADRDAHLKSDDFFNQAAFPNLTFKSTAVEVDGDEVKITGDLTIREVTKSITLAAEKSAVVVDPYGQTKFGLSFNGKIKRSDFNLRWSAVTEAGSIVVSDDVKLLGELQFVQQA
ncbi:MAG: YceI family protein [Bacteroidota bacterium]